ncbi:MAG: MFS transporter [Chloroflexi bacterium]|nr:MFS transporter [Chloroflexota bacterium]MDA1175104.1 MFS transporter [Chloroflexota bacterium]
MTQPPTSASGKRGLAPRPVIVIAIITGVCLLGDSSLYALLPSRLEAFSVTPTGAGLILGINRYIRILSNSGAGWVVQRVGVAWPLAFAVVLASATTFAYGAASGFWMLFVAHALWGVAWSFLRLGGYLAAAETGPAGSVGRHMGALQSLSRAGSLVAVVVGGLLADVIGVRNTLLLFGALTLGALALVPMAQIPAGLGKAQPKPAPLAQAVTEPGVASNRASDRALVWRIRSLYAQAAITWMLVAGLFMGTAGHMVRTVTGDGTTIAGVAIGVGTLSGIVLGIRWVADLGLSPLFGHLSDRLGRPRIILTAMAAAAAAMLTVAISPTLAVAIPMYAIIFAGGTALTVSLNASVAEMAPVDRRAVVLSRYATWADIGSGSGAAIGLPLVAGTGFGLAYGLGAALMTLAGLTYWAVFVKR